MDSVTWSSKYKTGIDVIDEQHRELFGHIDRLTLALYEGEGKSGLKELLEFLAGYVTEHFRVEEEMMSEHGYPEYDRHLEDHREFIMNFREIQKEYGNRGPDTYLAIRVEKQVKDWWKTHVLETDMLYAPYMKKS